MATHIIKERSAGIPPRRLEQTAEDYIVFAESIAGHGPLQIPKASLTERNIDGLWKRWKIFCKKTGKRPIDLLIHGGAQWYIAFFCWLLDKFPRIKQYSTLHQHFRVFKMLYEKHTRAWIDEETVKTVNSYLKGYFKKEFKLRNSSTVKAVASVDDLFRVLRYHWIMDTSVYADERQRVQIAWLLLIAAYTGQRPCSLLATNQSGPNPQEATFLKDLRTRECRTAIKSEHSRAVEDDEESEYCPSTDETETESEPEESPDRCQLVRGILYRDVRMLLLRNPTPGKRCLLVMQVTFVHTKGEDNKPQPKTFLFYENTNLLVCPIAYVLALALHDNAFEARSMHSLHNLFRVQIPDYKESLALTWRKDIENTPILRQPMKVNGNHRTSVTQPLSAHTASRHIKRAGEQVGFRDALTLYCFRRGLGNAVDDAAPTAVRDQVMGHADSQTFQKYLKQQVKFDVQAAFLEMPSNMALFKAVGQMSLNIDPTAPTTLSATQKRMLKQNHEIVRLEKERDTLTALLRERYGTLNKGKNDKLFAQKARAEAQLRREKRSQYQKLLTRGRSEHFSKHDTLVLEAQFDQTAEFEAPRPTHDHSQHYQLFERRLIADYLSDRSYTYGPELPLVDRIQFIDWLAQLCRRREVRRRSKSCTDEIVAEVKHHPSMPLECQPAQCIFCIGDDGLSYDQRTFSWSRRAKMMDHVEQQHLKSIPVDAKIACPHPSCKENGVLLPTVKYFKCHVAKIHKINLRANA